MKLTFLEETKRNPTSDDIKSDAEVWEELSAVAQLCPILCNPMDCSLIGSSIHGIFQARILEWGAIAFSDNSQ